MSGGTARCHPPVQPENVRCGQDGPKRRCLPNFYEVQEMVVAYVCFPSRCLHAERLASLYRHTSIPLDLLALKRSVVDVYRRVHVAEKWIEKPTLWTPKSAQKRKRTPDDIRQDGRLHHVSSGPTQRSCRQCGEKTKMLCLKCDAPLHVECSPVIHEI